MELRERALKLHKDNQGKIALQSKVPVNNKDDLTLAYTPGVAEPCLAIKADYNTQRNLPDSRLSRRPAWNRRRNPGGLD